MANLCGDPLARTDMSLQNTLLTRVLLPLRGSKRMFSDAARTPPHRRRCAQARALRAVVHPDSRRLKAACDEAAVACELVEAADMPHVYPLMPTPEGRAARAHLVELLAP